MTDVLSLQTNSSGWCNTHINEVRFNAIQHAATIDDAKNLRTLFEQITDWLNITHTDIAFEALHTLTHNQNETLDTSTTLKKIAAYVDLKNSLTDAYKDRLTLNSEPNEMNRLSLTVTLSNNNQSPLLTSHFEFGDLAKELELINNQTLNDDIAYLDTPTTDEFSAREALSKVSYHPKIVGEISLEESDCEMKGVVSENQHRLELHKLNKETRIAMSQDPKLAQQWVELKMKLAIHFDQLANELMPLKIKDLSVDSSEWANHWTTKITLQFEELLTDLHVTCAQQMNEQVEKANQHVLYV